MIEVNKRYPSDPNNSISSYMRVILVAGYFTQILIDQSLSWQSNIVFRMKPTDSRTFRNEDLCRTPFIGRKF